MTFIFGDTRKLNVEGYNQYQYSMPKSFAFVYCTELRLSTGADTLATSPHPALTTDQGVKLDDIREIATTISTMESIPKTMLAFAIENVGDGNGGRKLEGILKREEPVPVPGKGEALVRVLRAGVCNTDLELLAG